MEYLIDYENSDDSWDDEYDIYSDDVCCWDIRYKGPEGRCFCKEYHEAEDRARHWFFGRYDKMKVRILNFLFKIKDYRQTFFKKKACDFCKQESYLRHWNNKAECPKCGEQDDDLPF